MLLNKNIYSETFYSETFLGDIVLLLCNYLTWLSLIGCMNILSGLKKLVSASNLYLLFVLVLRHVCVAGVLGSTIDIFLSLKYKAFLCMYPHVYSCHWQTSFPVSQVRLPQVKTESYLLVCAASRELQMWECFCSFELSWVLLCEKLISGLLCGFSIIVWCSQCVCIIQSIKLSILLYTTLLTATLSLTPFRSTVFATGVHSVTISKLNFLMFTL